MPTTPRLRYLDAAAVEAAMPAIEERLRLAEAAMVGLASGAQLPPKPALHPRPQDAFAHAMPAFLRGASEDGADDLLGMKWVVGFPTNREHGLPAISALVLLDDPQTGLPIGILDGAPITAQRTAAISGVAIARFGPRDLGRAVHVAIIGAGVQGRAHLPIVAHLMPGANVLIHDRHPDRAEALAATGAALDGIASAQATPDVRSATADADVVVTAVAFGPIRQVLSEDWLAPQALVVAVDYATMVAASVARSVACFLVDERAQFASARDSGAFDDYPDPALTLGEAVLQDLPRPPGRVLVTHLGVGLADVIFGRAILRRAEADGLGTLLPSSA